MHFVDAINSLYVRFGFIEYSMHRISYVYLRVCMCVWMYGMIGFEEIHLMFVTFLPRHPPPPHLLFLLLLLLLLSVYNFSLRLSSRSLDNLAEALSA